MESLKRIDRLGSLGTDRTIILKQVSREAYEMNFTGSGDGPTMDFCDEGKKP